MRDNTLYSTTYNAFLYFCVGEFVEDEQEYENLNDTFNRKSSPQAITYFNRAYIHLSNKIREEKDYLWLHYQKVILGATFILRDICLFLNLFKEIKYFVRFTYNYDKDIEINGCNI